MAKLFEKLKRFFNWIGAIPSIFALVVGVVTAASGVMSSPTVDAQKTPPS